MIHQEITGTAEFAARDLVLRKVEEIAMSRGYNFWSDYVDQINYSDCSFGKNVGVEIIISRGEPNVIGVSVSGMQGDATTEKTLTIWLGPENKADCSDLDQPNWLCEFEPYALEVAQVVKGKPLSYWVERAGNNMSLTWRKQVGQEALDVELRLPASEGLFQSRRIHMLLHKPQDYGECSRLVEIAVDFP